jgi:hypothetical protein
MQPNNEKVAITFPNLNLLWQFAQTLSSKSFEIDARTATLYCECNPDDLEKAIKLFRGTLAGPEGK